MGKKFDFDKPARCRHMALELYPDDESHVRALRYVQENYEYAYILHNKDVCEEDIEKDGYSRKRGDLKKEHWHVVLSTPNGNAIWNTSLADKLQIEIRWVRTIGNLNGALKYLVHFDNPEKYQYDIENVKGTLKNKMINIIKKCKIAVDDEEILYMRIIEYIHVQGYMGYLEIYKFNKWIAENCLYSIYRRSAFNVNQFVKEHNLYIVNEKVDNENDNVCTRTGIEVVKDGFYKGDNGNIFGKK